MTGQSTSPLHILQFGATGQVALSLRALAGPGMKVIALARDAADLTDGDAISRAVESAPADVTHIVNAAAYTNVDAAETDRATAAAVNVTAPGIMAHAARKRGLPFIHLSTDYVFNGSGTRPYRESDPASPLGVYGATKLAGEEAALDSHPDAVIIRTSWVFSSHGKNFVKTMVRLATERDEVGVVDDQIGCPTPADSIAEAVVRIAQSLAVPDRLSQRSGVYHFCGDSQMSWCGFADKIFQHLEAAGLKRPNLRAIPTSAYATAAPRPAFSVLDCSRITQVFDVRPADCEAGLKRALNQILLT